MRDADNTMSVSTTEKASGATAAEVADLWGCTTRHVRRLVESGIAVRAGHNRYDARLSTRNYIAHLRQQAAGRGGADANAANARLKAAQAELLELKLKKQRGESLDRDDVRAVWSRIMIGTRNLVLGIPSAFHFEEPSLTPHAKAALERICRDRLEDAALSRGLAFLGPSASAL
jgi:phage terminase Nu1 subunit (DNA packaging protein)